MSDVLDLRLILRNTERAASAAEAALAISQRLETEIGGRIAGLESRFTALEGRIPALAAGLNSLERAVLKLNDKLLDHDARFDALEASQADHSTRLTRIE